MAIPLPDSHSGFKIVVLADGKLIRITIWVYNSFVADNQDKRCLTLRNTAYTQGTCILRKW